MPRSFESCPCAGITLDKMVRPAVLAVLARQPLHGYRVVERLGRLRISRGQKPDATGVYRALRAMQKEGLLASAWDAPAAGPAKRRYRLTPAGRTCLRRWVATLDDYRRGVAQLLGTLRRAVGPARPARRCACRRRTAAGKAAT